MPGYARNRAGIGEQRVTIESLQTQLDAFDQAALYEPDNFQGRAEVIDTIAFELIDRIDGLLGYPSQPRKLRSLRRAAERLQRHLEAVDEGGLSRPALSHPWRLPRRAAATDDRMTCRSSCRRRAGTGGCRLRSPVRLLTGILDSNALPEPRREPEPEMVLNRRGHHLLHVHLLRGCHACGGAGVVARALTERADPAGHLRLV